MLLKYLQVPGVAVGLLSALSTFPMLANSDIALASRQCAALRSTVLQHVGDRAKDLLFASTDMDRDGWLNPGIANDGFKAIQLGVMHFDYAYEAVAMGGRADTEECNRLAQQFGLSIDTYVDAVLISGELPR